MPFWYVKCAVCHETIRDSDDVELIHGRAVHQRCAPPSWAADSPPRLD